MFTAETITELQDILRDDFSMERSRVEVNAIANEIVGFFEFLISENGI